MPGSWFGSVAPDLAELVSVATPVDVVPELPTVDGRPPSAVLCAVWDTADGVEMLLTRRAWHLRSHTGEIAFPGGRREPDDADLVATACREAHEEVGLVPEEVSVVGVLPALTTVSSPAEILPVLAVLDGPPETTPEPGEVDAVLHVPVAELWDPVVYREELWPRGEVPFEITFFELVGDTLWGATARIVRQLFEAVVEERAS